jgi:hypothetical protein
MKPPTPTTTPIMVFLLLVLSPPPEEEPLSVSEAELLGAAEELVGEEDVEAPSVVLGGGVALGVVVEGGGVVDSGVVVVELGLEEDEDEEDELDVGVVSELEVELLLVVVVDCVSVVEVGVDVSVDEDVGGVVVLLAGSVEEESVGLSPFKMPLRPLSCRPRRFGLAIVAWVTAMAARIATRDCARKSMMLSLMDGSMRRAKKDSADECRTPELPNIDGVC